MELSIVNYYLEAGNELDFAYKLNHSLFKKLEKKYIKNTRFEKMFKGYVLCINASPSKRVKGIKLFGPHHDKKNKYLNYSIKMPYKEIIQSLDPKERYCLFVEDALKLILSEIGGNVSD